MDALRLIFLYCPFPIFYSNTVQPLSTAFCKKMRVELRIIILLHYKLVFKLTFFFPFYFFVSLLYNPSFYFLFCKLWKLPVIKDIYIYIYIYVCVCPYYGLNFLCKYAKKHVPVLIPKLCTQPLLFLSTC